MSEEQKKLESILLDVIEKKASEPKSNDYLLIISDLSRALIELWKI